MALENRPPPGDDQIVVRAIVVDDHPHVRNMVGRLLELAGGIAVVGTAGDGMAALDLVAQVSPDVVVMDLSMPILDGVEATRRLLAAPARPIVVALTASTALARRAMEAGAAACVFKDAEPQELVRAIRRAVASA